MELFNIINHKNPKPMQNLKSQNQEFLSQLLSLVFPGEFQDAILFTPDLDYSVQNAPQECHLNLYISPKKFTGTDKDIISDTPFNYFKPEWESQICMAWEDPKSPKFWDKVLYIPGFTLFCLKEEYLNLSLNNF